VNPQRRQPFNRTLLAGLAFLVLASVTKFALERQTSIGPDFRDGLFGLLMGFAIGSLVLGIWRMKHPAQGAR